MTFQLRSLTLCSLALLAVGPFAASGSHAAESGMHAPAKAGKKPFPTHFAKPTSVDCAQVLPAPPAPGTLASLADLEAVWEAQVWRTPEHVAWAKRVDKNDPFMAADVLGTWFTKENLPLTAAFLKDVDEDRHEITEVAKKLFARVRPYALDPRIQPCVGRPANDSYPSGHTSSIFTRMGVLAEIFPEKRTELFEFGHRAAWGRIYGGVHYPTDVVGGRLLGEAIVAELKKSPAFQQRLQQVRAEVASRTAAAR